MNRDHEHIDDAVRRSLESWQPDYRPDSWKQLEEKLDKIAGPTAADDDIRAALNEGIAPASAAAGWEQLAARLDAEEGDAQVSRQLERAPVPAYRPSSWARLAARLELIAQRRSCVVAYKITEMSLLLSALLLFWNYFPFAPSTQTGAPFPIPATTLIADAGEILTDGQAKSTTVSTQPATTTTGSPNENVSPSLVAALPASTFVTEISTGEEDFKVSTVDASTARIGTELLSSDILPASQASDLLPALSFSVNGLVPDPRPALRLAPKEKEKGATYLRAYVSPWDLNQVVTPAFALGAKEIDRDSRISYGTSAGIMLDVEHGKNGHSYGISYSRRSYIPTALAEVEAGGTRPSSNPLAPRDTNFSRITFHTVSLPFSYQRNLVNTGRWRIRAGIGVEASMVMFAKFYKSPNFNENIANYFTNTRRARSSGVRLLSARDLTHPEEGLLQGGSALQNSSFSLTFDLTIERQLTNRFGLYLAPRFTRALYYNRESGLGPLDDRIHQNAFQFGARWRLDR